MSPLRSVLLWASRNGWLRANVPRWPFVRRATRRFMPGEDLAAALGAAELLRADGIAVWLTHLGENLTSLEAAQAVADHYGEALRQAAAAGLRAEISVKPTQLGLDLDEAAALAHARRLATAQGEAAGMLWFDMEDHTYVDRTLALVRTLRDEGAVVGVCLQAYLRRTAADLESLAGSGIGVRLVKGAYAEPASLAFPAKRDVDLNFLALAARMLELGRGRGGQRVAFATHDIPLLERIAGLADASGIGRTGYEIGMLYGIRAAELRRFAQAGHEVRDLIAYGTAWYPWYMRRLAERPANVLFVLRQLVPGR